MKNLSEYLIEGILDVDDDILDNASENAQKLNWLEEHLRKENRGVKWMINPDGTIACKHALLLKIVYNDFDELPEFITFADDKYISFLIQGGNTKIKSFRGLPHIMRDFSIFSDMSKGFTAISGTMPDLNIEVRGDVTIRANNCKSFNNFNITYKGYNRGKLKLDVYAPLKGLHVNGMVILDFVNDFKHGVAISKALNRKAPMNKYRGIYTDPVTQAGVDAINNYFKGSIDLSTVEEIGYTQASCIVKHHGQWYRCKNW